MNGPLTKPRKNTDIYSVVSNKGKTLQHLNVIGNPMAGIQMVTVNARTTTFYVCHDYSQIWFRIFLKIIKLLMLNSPTSYSVAKQVI